MNMGQFDIVCAASDTPEILKASAQYVCPAADARETLQNAIDEAGRLGVRCILLKGTYVINSRGAKNPHGGIVFYNDLPPTGSSYAQNQGVFRTLEGVLEPLGFQNGAVIVVDDTAEERSGVGVIEMLKDGRSVARFVFAVNCIRRKKISYTIAKAKDKDKDALALTFECKSMPKGLSVMLVHHPSRLPCLKEDKEKNAVDKISLRFEKPEYKKTVEVKREWLQNKHVFSLTFADEKFNKYYYLHCKENKTMAPPRHFGALHEMDERSCPFCHRDVLLTKAGLDRYKKGGGMACRKLSDTNSDSLPVIYNTRDSQVKNCLYCAGDLVPYNPAENNRERRSVPRRLPPSAAPRLYGASVLQDRVCRLRPCR